LPTGGSGNGCCASPATSGIWAIEPASGLGALLAQQLVAVGETVLDVPPTLSARVRLLDAGCTDKTDPHDARAAAIVALRHGRLRQVSAVDHTAVLRLLADRHHDLTGLRTQAICRLHALLCGLTPGGAGRLLSASQAGPMLRGVRPMGPVEVERKRIALELVVGHFLEARRGHARIVLPRRRRGAAPGRSPGAVRGASRQLLAPPVVPHLPKGVGHQEDHDEARCHGPPMYVRAWPARWA
jgi:Transposase